MKQKKKVTLQIFLCLGLLGFCSFSYLEQQSTLTKLRLYIPRLMKEIKSIQEENVRLSYRIQEFESPKHLLEMAALPAFRHLKYPLSKEVIVLQAADPLECLASEDVTSSSLKPNHTLNHTLAVGVK
jgi:hypothetical protein